MNSAMAINPRDYPMDGPTDPPQNVVPMPPYRPPEKLVKSDDERITPHSVGSEKSAVSALLLSPERIRDCGLKTEHFHLPQTRIVFRHIRDMDRAGTPIDPSLLIQRLLDHGDMDRIGGPATVAELMTYDPTGGLHLSAHVSVLADKLARRAAIESARKIIETAHHDTTEIADLAREAKAAVEAVSVSRGPRVQTLFHGIAHYPTEVDPATVILGPGLLRRADVATFISTAGSGKSVGVTQAAIAWALKLPYFGMVPPQPLRILIFCGEDDASTIGQIREGFIQHSQRLTGKMIEPRVLALLDKTLRIEFTREFVGQEFHAHLDRLLTDEPADLVIINPLLSYVGGDVVEESPQWLRAGLMPVIQRHNCAALVAHHTPKMSKTGWQETDDIYSAIGGSELANIPRVIFTLRPTSAEGLFVLKAGKRSFTGWTDGNYKPVSEWFMVKSETPHAPAWIPVPYAEAMERIDDDSGNNGGGPKRKVKPSDVPAFLKTGPTQQSLLVEQLSDKFRCTQNPSKSAIKDAVRSGIVQEFSEKNPRGGIPIKWICLPEHHPKTKQQPE